MSKKRRKKPPVRRETTNQVENTQAKVVKTSTENTTRRKPAPRSKTTVKRKKASPIYSEKDMIFGRENYMMMVGGLVLILIGFMLMRGGQMPTDELWDSANSVIYSTTRITIAPILILLGLIVEILAIFRKPTVTESAIATEE